MTYSGRGITMAGTNSKKVQEFFVTNFRKIEAVGGNCVRVYCSLEREGVAVDEVQFLMPIMTALTSAAFLIDAATEIAGELKTLDGVAELRH